MDVTERRMWRRQVYRFGWEGNQGNDDHVMSFPSLPPPGPVVETPPPPSFCDVQTTTSPKVGVVRRDLVTSRLNSVSLIPTQTRSTTASDIIGLHKSSGFHWRSPLILQHWNTLHRHFFISILNNRKLLQWKSIKITLIQYGTLIHETDINNLMESHFYFKVLNLSQRCLMD